MSRIVFQNSYIAIIPSFEKTDTHKHPMTHLFFGRNGCKITADGKEIQNNIVLLDSNVKHILNDGSGCDFFLLIDPTSVIAEALHEKYMRENFYAGILGQNTNLSQDLCSISDDELIQTVEQMLSELGVNSNKTKAKDERIQQIIANIVLGKWL
ncbi:MAG: hypothetical protein K2O73_05430, partial [Lachnospiraceae bacterium]|nr:hypothetical protein [Lachnospiraceae bacterium]